jgi:alpha-tubulin suppressor-like RCC1 family protein
MERWCSMVEEPRRLQEDTRLKACASRKRRTVRLATAFGLAIAVLSIAQPRTSLAASHVDTGAMATQVSAGHDFTCAILLDGSLACWGKNSFGQSTPPSGTFTQVSAGDGLLEGGVVRRA